MNPQDIQKMLGQAQEMQQQMEQRLAATVVEAASGGGAVTVKMNGKKQVLSLKIDPTAVAGLGLSRWNSVTNERFAEAVRSSCVRIFGSASEFAISKVRCCLRLASAKFLAVPL